MSRNNEKADIIYKIEYKINNGKKIIITDSQNKKIIDLLCSGMIENDLSMMEIWHCIDSQKDKKMLHHISEMEMNELKKMHCLYDFSDKIIFVSDSNQYGTLFNYVKTGILTEQEMVNALLYKI